LARHWDVLSIRVASLIKNFHTVQSQIVYRAPQLARPAASFTIDSDLHKK
jgi:hypothetical protein